MHVLTNAEKLIPLRDAASLAESRRLAGMRMVTGTTSPSTRYERISVSPASCSIKSEYVIASHAFKPQYKCINYIPAWEQRKLGEVAHFINGRAYSQNELLFSGKYPVLRVGNFYTNDSWYYSDLELEDKNYAYEGDLLYTWSATFGPHIWHGNKVIYHYHIWKVQLEAALEKLFAFQLLERDKERILSDKNGSTMVHITKTGIENTSVLMPCSVEEQRRIGAFFDHLDSIITLHQRKRQWLKWLDEGGEGTHHDIDILVFKFADDMKISVLCGVHACMTKSLGHTGNRYAGKQQQRGMGVP